MIKSLLIFLITLVFIRCDAQKLKLDETKVYFAHSNDQLTNGNGKTVTLYFESGFCDSLIVRYAGKIVRRDFYKTEPSTSNTGKTLELKCNNTLRGHRFTVESIRTKSMIKVIIMKGYRVIEIARDGESWSVIYSNVGPQFE